MLRRPPDLRPCPPGRGRSFEYRLNRTAAAVLWIRCRPAVLANKPVKDDVCYDLRMRLDLRPDVADKAAIVVGSSHGIDRTIAQRLAAAGATVVVTSRSPAAAGSGRRHATDYAMARTLAETVSLIESAGSGDTARCRSGGSWPSACIVPGSSGSRRRCAHFAASVRAVPLVAPRYFTVRQIGIGRQA